MPDRPGSIELAYWMRPDALLTRVTGIAGNDLPETQAMAGKMVSLCDGEVTFHNLDVVREDNP